MNSARVIIYASLSYFLCLKNHLSFSHSCMDSLILSCQSDGSPKSSSHHIVVTYATHAVNTSCKNQKSKLISFPFRHCPWDEYIYIYKKRKHHNVQEQILLIIVFLLRTVLFATLQTDLIAMFAQRLYPGFYTSSFTAVLIALRCL